MILQRTLVALACLAGSAAMADHTVLFAGGAEGHLLRADPQDGIFTTLGPVSVIDSIALVGDRLLVGDHLGNIFRVNPETGQVEVCLAHSGGPDAVALAEHEGDLLVASSDGTIRRINPETGQVLGSLSVPTDVYAMAVDGDTLFVGGHQTIIWRGDARTGGFQMIGACGGQVDSMTMAGGDLLLGTPTGTVYRFSTTGAGYVGQFNIPGSTNTALAMDHDVLLASSGDGRVRRVNPVSGEVFATFKAGTNIRAMALVQTACAADFDGDGSLGLGDFVGFRNAYVAGDAGADMNGDGLITLDDFVAFRDAYTAGCD